VGSVLETAIMGLTPEEQIELVKRLGWYMNGQGIISKPVGFPTSMRPGPLLTKL
jgi:phosphatidate cytidylyltransferase